MTWLARFQNTEASIDFTKNQWPLHWKALQNSTKNRKNDNIVELNTQLITDKQF